MFASNAATSGFWKSCEVYPRYEYRILSIMRFMVEKQDEGRKKETVSGMIS